MDHSSKQSGGLLEEIKTIIKAAESLGFYNVLEGLFLTRFKWFWMLVEQIGFLRLFVNKTLVNSLVTKMPPRPNALSTLAPYTSWDSLTDHTWSARHLPPISQKNLPPASEVAELFRRPAGKEQKAGKSTVLFTYFAQWFTDGFLRTDYVNLLKNTSNHDIDLSNLYGLNPESTQILRSHVDGKLKSQQIKGEEYPPFFYQDGQPGAGFESLPMATLLKILESAASLLREPSATLPPRLKLFLGFTDVLNRKPLDEQMFAMGGDRINSQVGFVAMNVLFLREHNRICTVLKQKTKIQDDERLFQTARNIMIVMLMKIVIEQYINHITPYQFKLRLQAGAFEYQRWYRRNWMAQEFNLLYRWHSLVPDAYTIGGQSHPLHDTLFCNRLLINRGLGGILDDASRQAARQVGLFNTPEVLLPVEEGSIEQGRVSGLAGYNDYRELCQIKRATSFDQITNDPVRQERLKDLYGSVDRVEYYPGIFAEDVVPNSVLPFLIGRIVSVDAFSQALTNPLVSANIYNERTFDRVGLEILESTSSLSDILHRNIPPGSGPFHITMDQH